MEKTTCPYRLRTIALLSVSALIVTTFHSITASVPVQSVSAVFTECADGIDNDHDGLIDYPQDKQCLSLHDDSEGPTGRGLFLSLSDKLTTVTPGGHMTYTVALRTEREEPVVIDVFFQMPHQTNLIGVTDGGFRDEELIIWKNVSVYPGRQRELYVNVNVTPHAEKDLLLVAEATAEGEKDTDTTKVVEDDDAATASLEPLNISVTDGKKYAQPGEVLEYLISVRNPTSTSRDYTLRFQLPTDTTIEYVEGDHSSNRKAITWMNQQLDPGSAREYRVSLRVADDAQEFFMIRTHASVGAAKASDTTTVHTGVLPNALIVSTTDNLTHTVPGSLVTYDIYVDNGTNQLATEVDVTNDLPDFLEFVDASEGGYWTGKNVRWNGLSVAPSGQRTLRVTGRVRSDAPLGERLRNTARVKGFESVDYTEVGETIAGPGLDLAGNRVLISKRADRFEVRPGDSVSFTVSVENLSQNTLRNVKVEDRMDSPHIRILRAESGKLSRNRLNWTIPEIAPGKTWTVRYTVEVDARSPHGTTIPNVVTVSGEGMETLSLTERITTSQLGVISNLPPTGAAFDAIFLALTGLIGIGQTAWIRRRALI